MNTDRPTPRTRVKATPAVDEVAGATPIAPSVAPLPATPVPAVQTGKSNTFAQLNVRITPDVQHDVEYLMARDGVTKVSAVSEAIRKRATELRAADRPPSRS